MMWKFCKIVLTWSFIMFPMSSSALPTNYFRNFQEKTVDLFSFHAILHNPVCADILSFFTYSKLSMIEGQTNLMNKRRLQADSESTKKFSITTSENYPSSQPSSAYVAPTVPEDILTTLPTVEYPTSQPSSVFVAPTRPEDFMTAMPTVVEISEPMKSTVSMKPSVTLPISDGGVIDRGNVAGAGAEDVNEELREEGHTALSSAKYFFFTFLVCVGLFAGIHTIKRRCGSGQNLTADMKPKYNLLSMSESAEEEDGGFFSNRNIELANRSSSNSLFDSERINSPPSDISNPPHHSSSSG